MTQKNRRDILKSGVALGAGFASAPLLVAA